MAFKLGNFNIDEIIYGVAQDFDGPILYTLDQLSSASIEISSDSTDITDKHGNVVRTIYTTKSGTFSSTNAFLHPQVMNAASGSDIKEASSDAPIVMPKILVVEAGTTTDELTGIKDDKISVIGLYGSGANSKALTQANPGQEPSVKNLTYKYDSTEKKITVPKAEKDAPVNYLIKYDRDVESGMELSNLADKFPQTVQLTLYCSMVDPCNDTLRACYVVLPSFQADPSATISLDRETQEMDFNGSIQVGYCASQKALYYIYFPDEDAVTTAVTA